MQKRISQPTGKNIKTRLGINLIEAIRIFRVDSGAMIDEKLTNISYFVDGIIILGT